ncbi:MAG: hypothetical protein JXR70_05155 [Spirochaetales bacterium]|nr:hypothetical protein [Spirochaetales bacterium]
METELEKKVFADINPIIEAMDFHLIDLKIGRRKGIVDIHIVIFSSSGISIGDCSSVSKGIYPRLELFEELEKFSLSVASTGLNWQIKRSREYPFYIGKALRILLPGASEWIKGELQGVNQENLIILTAGESRALKISDIKKAKLDL